MTLTTTKSEPKNRLLDYTISMHGFPKIGKSTLANDAGKVLFADTEGGLGALSVYKEPVMCWNSGNNSFANLVTMFLNDKHDYEALCIDTIDALHKLCSNYVLGKQSVIHASDLEWGKGWDMIKTEFMRPLNKLAVSPYGLILISHSRMVEIQNRTSKVTKAVPTLQANIWYTVEAFVDIIIYFHSEESEEGEKRLLRTKPSEKWVAGDRTKRLLNADPIEVKVNENNWLKLEQAFTDNVEQREQQKQPLIKPLTKQSNLLGE